MSDKPANVIDALSRVIADMPGIGKNDDSSQGYKYRGIEAITREVQQLLGRHGVVFVPHVLDWQTDQLTVNNKPWTDTRLKVEYEVFGPGGPEDRITVGPICAIGRDNSDKGANKAMTQAFKYALLQTLCIGDAKDDGDQSSHEADSHREEPDQAPCPKCGEVVPGARSDREPMRAHMVAVHNYERLEDGTVAPRKDASPPVGQREGDAVPAPDDATRTEAPEAGTPNIEVIDRLLARLDAMPDEKRRHCEDALAAGFDDRFPYELTAGDISAVSRVISSHENGEHTDVAQRAQALAAKHSKGAAA